jgi:hypothetical protein
MNAGIGDVANGNPSFGRRRWWLLVPAFLLSCFSAYLFVKFIGAAFFYSDWGPLTSATPADKVTELTYASHRAHAFFLYAVVVALAALLIVPVLQLRRFRLPVRYILVVVLCILVVGASLHVFFVYSAVVAAFIALLMSPTIQNRMDSKGFRLVIRYLLALVLSVLTTEILVWILDMLKIG